MLAIGWPEIAIVIGTLVLTALPIVITGFLVWIIVKRQLRHATVPTRPCPHCGHKIPELGSYCPICGQSLR
jgi:hypothetical protein